MTDQQQHLVNLLQQRENLVKEIEEIQNTISGKRELYWKVQGAIEYLQQLGVTLPEPDSEEQSEE